MVSGRPAPYGDWYAGPGQGGPTVLLDADSPGPGRRGPQRPDKRPFSRRILIIGVIMTVVSIGLGTVLLQLSSNDTNDNTANGAQGGQNPGSSGGPNAPGAPGASATASPNPSASAHATPTAGKTPRPSTSTASRGDLSAPDPATFGWPDATTTGVPSGTSLTKQSAGNYVISKSTTIDGWDFSGTVEIKANNVTIKNSRIRCANGDVCVTQDNGFKGLHLLHDDIGLDSGWGNAPEGILVSGGGSQPSDVNNNIVEYTHIHNVGDGFRIDGQITLRYNYVHALDMTNDGAHSDGIQTFGGDYVLIYHNTIEGGNTSDILVQGGNSSNWVIDDNMLLGRQSPDSITSFAIGFDKNSCPKGGCQFVNNHVNRTWQSGVSYDRGPWNSSNWSGNVFQDNDATVPVPN